MRDRLGGPRNLKFLGTSARFAASLGTFITNQQCILKFPLTVLAPKSIQVNPSSQQCHLVLSFLVFPLLIARGERTILQSEHKDGRLGFVFDDNGVREVSAHNSRNYKDDKSCCLLVSADGKMVYPFDEFDFCDTTIVVTSPNMRPKLNLENWRKQFKAGQFIAPPPSCHEVVYLLYIKLYWMYREWTRDFRHCIDDYQEAISYLEEGTLSEWYGMKQQHITDLVEGMLSGGQRPNEAHQIRDTRTNLMIPSVLVTMKRLGKATHRYNIEFATPRIAQIVVDVQETQRWANSWIP